MSCPEERGHLAGFLQAEDGGIHDPNPSGQYCPPKMMKLSSYNVVLTVTIMEHSDKV